MKLKVLAVLMALSCLGYYHTHTAQYISDSYDDFMTKECSGSPMCLLGAYSAKDSVTVCMKDSFLSTSRNTIEKCLDKYIAELKDKN